MNKKKAEAAALKIIQNNVANKLGGPIADLMINAKESGLSKKEAKEMAKMLLDQAFEKISKNPEKYERHHNHY